MPTWGELLAEAGTASEGYEPLPTGTYDAKIVKAQHKVAQSGKSMFEAQFQITSGPHANRSVWNRFVVVPDSPKALAYFFSNMRALGLNTEFFSASPSDDQVAAALVDKVCRIEVGQTEYQGSTRNEVKKVMPPEGGPTVSAPVSQAPATPASPSPLPPTATPSPTAPAAPF